MCTSKIQDHTAVTTDAVTADAPCSAPASSLPAGRGRAPFIARAVSAPGTAPLSGGGYATIPIYCVDT